jgi:dienelactone hydrolase
MGNAAIYRRPFVRGVAALLVVVGLAGTASPSEISLSPQQLYDGFAARKVILEGAGARLALDPRAFQFGTERHGVVVTDPIDLGPRDGIVGLPATIESVAVDVSAQLPTGSAVDVEARSGPNRFDENGWSPWHRLANLRDTIPNVAGRYLQLRLRLRGGDAAKRPAVTGVTLKPKVVAAPPWQGELAVAAQNIKSVVRSPIEFHSERPDQPKLARFRRAARLDDVVAGADDDFAKLVRLMDWVGSGTNRRDESWQTYPWDIDRVCAFTSAGMHVVSGHCMSYAEVLITAATALGYHARHWAIEGFRNMGHEVVEIWVPSLQKWVYFDPSLTSYYYDKEMKVPLSVLELHQLVAERFLKSGEDMTWWSRGDADNEPTKARVRGVGGQAHVACRVGPYSYGRPMPRDYDWGWNHGYLATGFLQLTPRNDFHSHPEHASRHFGDAERFVADGYPFWVDEKTAPQSGVNHWLTRPRDFYWTPDRATLDLVKAEEGTLLVEFGQSMPYFRRYRVVVDGVEVDGAATPFRWKLKVGVNRLEVLPVDEYGKIGTGSSVEVRYTAAGQRRPDPPEQPYDRPIRKYLADRAAELERELLPWIGTAAELDAARPGLRAELLDMLGLKPLPERTPLNAKLTGRFERDTYTVEKLHFQSRPGLYVTANLYLPKTAATNPPTRFPAILYQCGHASQMKRDGTKAAADHQSHAIWFATHGYVALVVDTLELGEIAAVHRGLLSQNRWWWYSAGYTPAGVECWNAIRALDYLVSRPEVDPDRIGATGISGGGIGTFWVAAADERVKVAAPVSGMGDLTFYAGEGGTGRHCDCFFFPNRARWNWMTIAALICPRPLLFVNSDNDTYFPMGSNERIANRLQRLYSLFGAGDQAPAMISIGGHGYRTDVRRAVFEFFNRHFKGDGRRVTDADVAEVPRGQFPIDPRELRVFPTDADLPRDQLNTRVDETFVPRGRVELPSGESFEAWRRDLLERLRPASFAAWPAKPPDGPVTSLGEQSTESREVTESGIEVFWRWLPGKAANGTHCLIVLNPGDEPGQVPAWARDFVGEGSVLLLCPRGVGPVAWTRNVFPNAVERAFPLLGGTSDSGRVWDVMTVARRHALGSTHWRAVGQGNAGVIAAYAALYEPAIGEVIVVDPPASHQPRTAGEAYGPPLINVLRVLDIPDALGCLAPRRLVLIGAAVAAFDRTSALYRLAGASDRLERK